jgi:hypothetical protein
MWISASTPSIHYHGMVIWQSDNLRYLIIPRNYLASERFIFGKCIHTRTSHCVHCAVVLLHYCPFPKRYVGSCKYFLPMSSSVMICDVFLCGKRASCKCLNMAYSRNRWEIKWVYKLSRLFSMELRRFYTLPGIVVIEKCRKLQ